MKHLPCLNFPPFRFRISTESDRLRIWGSQRRTWLVLTPEEWVRRHLVAYLTEHCGASPALVREECPVCITGMNQRADVVVYDRAARPLLLAECKGYDVEINASAFHQATRYNAVLQARYVVVTNGLRHFIHRLSDDGSHYTPLDKFPRLDI